MTEYNHTQPDPTQPDRRFRHSRCETVDGGCC